MILKTACGFGKVIKNITLVFQNQKKLPVINTCKKFMNYLGQTQRGVYDYSK